MGNRRWKQHTCQFVAVSVSSTSRRPRALKWCYRVSHQSVCGWLRFSSHLSRLSLCWCHILHSYCCICSPKMHCGSSNWRNAQRQGCPVIPPLLSLSVLMCWQTFHSKKKPTWDIPRSFPFPYLVNIPPICLCSIFKWCEEKIIVPSLCLYFHKIFAQGILWKEAVCPDQF